MIAVESTEKIGADFIGIVKTCMKGLFKAMVERLMGCFTKGLYLVFKIQKTYLVKGPIFLSSTSKIIERLLAILILRGKE